jgi:hypothetical protein
VEAFSDLGSYRLLYLPAYMVIIILILIRQLSEQFSTYLKIQAMNLSYKGTVKIDPS